MAKIYVTSSWKNVFQQDIVAILRDLGHEVYDFKNPFHGNGGFQWSDIDPDWQNWTTEQYREALNHPIAQKGFDSDFNGMKWVAAGYPFLVDEKGEVKYHKPDFSKKESMDLNRKFLLRQYLKGTYV